MCFFPREAGSAARVERATTEGRNQNVKTFINLLKNDSGASAAEYALILAIVGGALAIASIALGGEIAEAMNEAGSCIDAGPACTA